MNAVVGEQLLHTNYTKWSTMIRSFGTQRLKHARVAIGSLKVGHSYVEVSIRLPRRFYDLAKNTKIQLAVCSDVVQLFSNLPAVGKSQAYSLDPYYQDNPAFISKLQKVAFSQVSLRYRAMIALR